MKIEYLILVLIVLNIVIEIAKQYKEKYKQNISKPKPRVVTPGPGAGGLTDAQKKKIQGKQVLARERKK